MLHGFTGSPASMRPMGERLAEAGLAVEGVRLPGHGTEVGDLPGRAWSEWRDEAAARLSRLRGRCRTVVVLGQSMGGALAVHLAATRQEVDGVVLASPYVFDPRLRLLPIGRLVLRRLKGIGNDIARPGQDEMAYEAIPVESLATMYELLQRARADLRSVRCPALVFEPAADHTIPRSNPRKVFAGLGSDRKTLVRCPNSYHVITLDHDAEMVAARILTFARELDAQGG